MRIRNNKYKNMNNSRSDRLNILTGPLESISHEELMVVKKKIRETCGQNCTCGNQELVLTC